MACGKFRPQAFFLNFSGVCCGILFLGKWLYFYLFRSDTSQTQKTPNAQNLPTLRLNTEPYLILNTHLFVWRKRCSVLSISSIFANESFHRYKFWFLVLLTVFNKAYMSHSQMLGKFEYTLPAKFWRLVGCTEMLSW